MGIKVQLEEEACVPAGEGYQFAVLGDNDADVDILVAEQGGGGSPRSTYNEPTDRHRWIVGDEAELAGRLGVGAARISVLRHDDCQRWRSA